MNLIIFDTPYTCHLPIFQLQSLLQCKQLFLKCLENQKMAQFPKHSAHTNILHPPNIPNQTAPTIPVELSGVQRKI